LAELPIKGRAPKTGYSREQFGSVWTTLAGCDARNRVLARDLTDTTYAPGDSCAVRGGRLQDPYTGKAITFTTGAGVDIDHVVALSDAWQKGAQHWPQDRREAFANDPLNLLAVDASANRQKGAGDAATWLPSNKRFRCAYVARQIAVKREYGLWTTKAEHEAMARILATCPEQPLPGPAPAAERRPAGGPTYASCADARAHGATPLLRGTPGYEANRRLDRDGDGVACER
jgi:hypothetical protein